MFFMLILNSTVDSFRQALISILSVFQMLFTSASRTLHVRMQDDHPIYKMMSHSDGSKSQAHEQVEDLNSLATIMGSITIMENCDKVMFMYVGLNYRPFISYFADIQSHQLKLVTIQFGIQGTSHSCHFRLLVCHFMHMHYFIDMCTHPILYMKSCTKHTKVWAKSSVV